MIYVLLNGTMWGSRCGFAGLGGISKRGFSRHGVVHLYGRDILGVCLDAYGWEYVFVFSIFTAGMY